MLELLKLSGLIAASAPMRFNEANRIAKLISTKDIDGETILSLLNNDMRAIGLYICHLAHESANFKYLEESGNYSPKVAARVFKRYFNSAEEAALVLAEGDDEFFDTVYGGRMGNNEDEGDVYRGRGWLQLTGRDNYEAMSEITGNDYVSKPEKVADHVHSAYVSAGYLILNPQFKNALLEHSVEDSCLFINGGYNGIGDRQERFDNVCTLLDGGIDTHAVLNEGDESLYITILQHLLAGYLGDDELLIDGDWGSGTSDALESAFDEVVTSVTINDLLSLIVKSDGAL